MSKEYLLELLKLDNVADELDEQKLENIGNCVLHGYQDDLNSCSEWMEDVKRIEELAILKKQEKNTPLPNSSNVKLPIITKACYEYSSRAYPEIVKNDELVKAEVIGKDFSGNKLKKARKVTTYMNWQLFKKNREWESDLDTLLTRLPLVGFLCKKTYYDPINKRVRSVLCEPQDLVIHADAPSLELAPRISHVLRLRLNDLISAQRNGLYVKKVVDDLILENKDDSLDRCIEVIEQHGFLDLDDDNYLEPYIITILKETGKVLRIVPRFEAKGILQENNEIINIIPLDFFVAYHFLKSPKGKFQSVGFGVLLLYLNECCNTILNQLIDAGRLSNLKGGYIDARLKEIPGTSSLHNPGEFKKLKTVGNLPIRDGILPIEFREPSSVLYQLLGLLIETARDLSSSNDIMTGNSSPENSKTGATQALIAEGVKIHNSINKRVYKSLGEEFYKIFLLDGIYFDEKEAVRVLDEEITSEDFDPDVMDIMPVADPNLSSGVKLAAEIQTLTALQSLPGIDSLKVTQRIIKKLNITDSEELLIDPKQLNQPNPEAIKIQAEIENMAEQSRLKAADLDLRHEQLDLDRKKAYCDALKMKADAMLSIAKAESLEAGPQLDIYMKELDLISKYIDNQMNYSDTNSQPQQEVVPNESEAPVMAQPAPDQIVPPEPPAA